MKHVYLAIFATFLSVFSLAQQVATFDDLTLDANKFWNGSDLSGSFTSGGFVFKNSFNAEWLSWSGFAYTNTTDVSTPGYENQYSAITGSGNNASANYAVCYTGSSAEVVLPAESKISGFYVTNSTYAYLSMKNGDTYSKKFGGESGKDPDFFKLTMEALDDEGQPVDSKDFYLADFRFEDDSKDYIISKWTWVDLGDLKATKKIRFSLSSSDVGAWGMNTPAYFCMDDFNGQKPYEYLPVTFAGFENLALGAEKYYNGSDLKGELLSGNFRFLNSYNASWGSWSGFAASTTTDTSTPGYTNQYSAITGQGVAGTPTYATVYPAPVSTVLFKDTLVSGVYVTNSAYAYLSMKDGDQYAKKFGGESGNDPDWFKLTIEGFDSENQSTGKIDVLLADFTDANNANDYILDTWKWVGLESLGRIAKLEFSVSSSDNGLFGMNTPAYFCIDNLNHQVGTFTNQLPKLQVSVYPNPFTDYAVVSGISDKAKISLTDISGKLIRRVEKVSGNQTIDQLGHLISGIYFLNVTDNGRSATVKLVKK